MDKNTEDAFMDKPHITGKNISSKIHINDLRSFFWWMALFSFVGPLVLSFARSYMYAEVRQTGNILEDVLFNRFIECVIKALTAVPIIMLVYHYKKKFSSEKCMRYRTILSVVMFLYIICGMIIPFIVTAISSSYEIADLIIIFMSAFCMFYTGEIANIKALRKWSYVFVTIPLLLLGTYFAFDIYYQYSNTIGFSSEIVYIFSLLKGLCNITCPSLCYITIAVQTRKYSLLEG